MQIFNNNLTLESINETKWTRKGPFGFILQCQELQIYKGPFGSLTMHLLAGDHPQPPQGPLT